MKDYKYTFTYQCDDKIYTLVCSAEITMEDLKHELMYFLRGCSWSEDQTAFLEEDSEEAIRSAVMSEQYDKLSLFYDEAVKNEWSSDKILDELSHRFI